MITLPGLEGLSSFLPKPRKESGHRNTLDTLQGHSTMTCVVHNARHQVKSILSNACKAHKCNHVKSSENLWVRHRGGLELYTRVPHDTLPQFVLISQHVLNRKRVPAGLPHCRQTDVYSLGSNRSLARILPQVQYFSFLDNALFNLKVVLSSHLFPKHHLPTHKDQF